jgi:P27 family predicted phage terminase small subunit
MPEGVSDETAKFMTDVIKELNKKKVIQNIDLGAMRMLATSYEMYKQATDKLLVEGPVIIENLKTIVNPCQTVATKNYAQVMKTMTEYGLTVKSRSTISTMKAPKEEDSPLDKYIKGNKRKKRVEKR